MLLLQLVSYMLFIFVVPLHINKKHTSFSSSHYSIILYSILLKLLNKYVRISLGNDPLGIVKSEHETRSPKHPQTDFHRNPVLFNIA